MNMNPMTSTPRAAPIPPLPTHPTNNHRPLTPPTQRVQSGVSINVFASSDLNPSPAAPKPLNISKPGFGDRESHQTTFDDLLYAYKEEEREVVNQKPDLATLRKGEPFVQQPLGHVGHVRGESKGSNGSGGRRGGGVSGHRRDGSGVSRGALGGGNMV